VVVRGGEWRVVVLKVAVSAVALAVVIILLMVFVVWCGWVV